jgi:hypothetical protein
MPQKRLKYIYEYAFKDEDLVREAKWKTRLMELSSTSRPEY